MQAQTQDKYKVSIHLQKLEEGNKMSNTKNLKNEYRVIGTHSTCWHTYDQKQIKHFIHNKQIDFKEIFHNWKS